MKNVIVACDEYCYVCNGDFYLRDFAVVLINRYLRAFDSVKFVVRTKQVRYTTDLEKYRNKVSDNRINVIPIPFFQGPSQFLKVYRKVVSVLKTVSLDSDCAILRLPSTTAFMVAKSIGNQLPYAVEVVADCYDMYKGSHSIIHKIIWYSFHKIMQRICYHALAVSCVTKFYLQNHYFSKKRNSIYSSYSSIEMPESFRFHARQYPDKKQMNIVLVANQVYLESRKGHKIALQALALLQEKGYQAKLIFVGEDYFDGISSIVEYAKKIGVHDSLTFTGFLSSDSLRKVLLESDILLLPTFAEGLPRVVIEGMALGLPCITTPVSGNPELVDSEFLVNYDDVEGFASKLIKLITNKSIYEQQSQINFERSLEYTDVVLNQKRTDFYNEIINLI